MWKSTTAYLSDPHLVIKTQKFFGVQYCFNENSSSNNFNNGKLDTVKRKTIEFTKDFDNSKGQCVTKETTIHSKSSENELSSDSEVEEIPCSVTNKFWFYVFIVCTALGDEIFYATFIPFWFWNIDGAVGRRVVLVWTIVMYIGIVSGQGIKDIIRMPRPGPPVQKLQKKWAVEYGMPSTHAMVGVSIPFSILLYTIDRYQYSFMWGLLLATLWCSSICISRIYLGMHSVLDIVAGLLLAVVLMIPLIPMVDALDIIILTHPWSPILVLIISVVVIVYYPNSDKWTPTRGDTTMVVSVCAGIQIGAWINYHLGHMEVSTAAPPYKILWPSYDMLGLTILRTIIGFCGVIATRAIAKSLSYAFVCALLGKDKNELRNSPNSLQNKDKIIVELSYKYFTCCMIGLNTLVLLPNVFKLVGIERPTFYTEI